MKTLFDACEDVVSEFIGPSIPAEAKAAMIDQIYASPTKEWGSLKFDRIVEGLTDMNPGSIFGVKYDVEKLLESEDCFDFVQACSNNP